MSTISRQLMEKLIFMQFQPTTRFTQDSPVYPDVWMEYFTHARQLDSFRVDLILTPHIKSTASELLNLLSAKVLKPTPGKQKWEWGMEETKGAVVLSSAKSGSSKARLENANWDMATSGESVVARLSLAELVRLALPMTKWWQQYLWLNDKPTPHLIWLKQLVGALLCANNTSLIGDQSLEDEELLPVFEKVFNEWFDFKPAKTSTVPMVLWSVSNNRKATVSIEKSVPATKADAGRRLFAIDGSEIAWAVIDSGIDARHKAFRKKDPKTGKMMAHAMGTVQDKSSNNTRIVATYDFTKFRDVLAMIHGSRPVQEGDKELSLSTGNNNDQALDPVEFQNFVADIDRDLRSGRLIDWSAISPLLRIPHNARQYVPPVHPHGTHVAGILGAGMDELVNGYSLIGMCPGISIYDIRVMDESGTGEEFNILAAIQFVRWMNSQKEGLIIHGVNMSFSMLHKVSSFACGLTPVCEACERLVAEGTVVVAASGNQGQAMYQSPSGATEQGFRIVNITDPGNAASVITVGATHRNRPHSYGVSYFSSKGPTGDGRSKPDLVAPGEKIVSVGLNDSFERMDGTSMSAPHVSGAAALILAKHRELIGKPAKIKEVLCNSATDLGREKYFQGAGMVDVLRAIQSV